MEDETIKKVENVIKILETKPQIEFVSNTKELGPCEVGIAYPNYPNWVYEIEELFHPVTNYDDLVKTLRKQNKPVEQYNILEVRASLTYLVRGERFCNGHMATCIEGGYLIKWLKRYLELLMNGEQ